MFQLTPRRAQAARAFALAVALAIALGLLFAWVLAPIAACSDAHWVLQTAGTAERGAAINVGGPGCDFGTSLVIDLVLIATYAVLFGVVIDRGGRRFRSLPGRRLARRLRWLPIVVGVLDVIENALMTQWVLPSGYTADYQVRWVAAVSMPRWALTFVMLGLVAAAVWSIADEG